MKIRCRTNLDLFNEKWPTEKQLKYVPKIGEQIESLTDHPQYKKNKNGISIGGRPTHFFTLKLEVCSVTYKKYDEYGSEYFIEIELHIPKNRPWSILDFYNWYAPLVGKSKSAFI